MNIKQCIFITYYIIWHKQYVNSDVEYSATTLKRKLLTNVNVNIENYILIKEKSKTMVI